MFKLPKLPKLTAFYSVVQTDPKTGQTRPTGQTFRLHRYQNPRESREATLRKLSADAQRHAARVSLSVCGSRAKLREWRIQ